MELREQMVEAPPELQGVTKVRTAHTLARLGGLAGCKANTSGAAGKIHVGWGSLGGVALRLNCGLCKVLLSLNAARRQETTS